MPPTRERAVRLAESAAAIGLIVMRLLVGASTPWWTDWIVVAAAVWLLSANVKSERVAVAATHLLMFVLAAIYLGRQGPWLLAAFGYTP